MFNATTNYADFKRNILAVSSVTEHALFVAQPDGIFFYGMDPSHVALVLIDWPSSDFESYECDKTVRIGMDTNTLSKIIKRLSSKLEVEISVEKDIMILKSGSAQFKVRLLDVDEQKRVVPQIPTTVEFTIDAKELATIIGDVEVTTDYVGFNTNSDKLSFEGKGDDGEVKIDTETVIILNKSYDGSAWASYSIEYIKPFVSYMEGDITLKFATNKPVNFGMRACNVHFGSTRGVMHCLDGIVSLILESKLKK